MNDDESTDEGKEEGKGEGKKKVRKIPEIVREWFAAKLERGEMEYAEAWPTSVAPLIVKGITFEEISASLRSSVVSAIGSVARGDGKNAVRDYDGGTVYIDPIDIPLLDDYLHDYLFPQLRFGSSVLGRARQRTTDWVAAHPDQMKKAGLTLDELWSKAVKEAAAE